MLSVEFCIDSITKLKAFNCISTSVLKNLRLPGKTVIMGDFNIDLLKCESSNHSHNFLSSLQSCYLNPAIDKPTRVRPTSATLIDNIFINNPDKVIACGNLITDLSDHFSQFCILKSMKAKTRVKKMLDFSRFSSDRLNADLCNVDWNALFANESNDVNSIFSSFYNKFN